MKQKTAKRLSYEEQKLKCNEFLTSFEDYDMEEVHERFGRKKYLTQLQKIANEEAKVVEILVEDLESFFRREDEKDMVEAIKHNTLRYISIFTEAIEHLLPKRDKPIDAEEELHLRFTNILREQRRENLENQNQALAEERELIPFSAHKKFQVSIIYGPGSKLNILAIHELDAHLIGSLVIVKAIVLRTSEIKPEIIMATYACDICGSENYLEVLNSEYRPLDKCTSKKCVENKVNGKLTFLASHSTFASFQEVRIQETSDQLHDGSIPRSFTLHLRDSNIKKASPGDIVLVHGVLVANRRKGIKHQHDLAFQSHIEAFKLVREKKKYVEMALSPEQVSFIHSTRNALDEDTLFDRLADSIAPEIFGMKHVKKALLLQMVGGVSIETHDNLRIRGEINIALIGDPGIAKSQLLKHISYLAPRAIYTTGKGSSGVGLTAAIVMDPTTKELCLEAGALILADMGVCCIDQFDKMDEFDRTAIHEVMEQQTVSIAKAGINTTLNARTSILAAANPLYGRYNKKETPHKNINMPAALLSRFDLVFLLLDEENREMDLQLARHIGYVHRHRKAPVSNVFDQSFLRAYIALAKRYDPKISQHLHHSLIETYCKQRREQMQVAKQGENYTTPRTLLALIRLCQARARLRFSDQVSAEDVAQCIKIQADSQRMTVENPERKAKFDIPSTIFEIIKQLCFLSKGHCIDTDKARKAVLHRGFTDEDFEISVKEYNKFGALFVEDTQLMLMERQ